MFLITGSNGLLGQKLVDLLQNQNEIRWIATARGKNRNPKLLDTHFTTMDITNQEEIEQVFERYKPSVLIHTAAMTQVDDCETQQEACWLQNVQAVEYLINACSKYHTFFVHLSTDFIFDGSTGPYDEEATAHPISFYGKSKWEAEKLLQNSSIDWAIARTVLVYGIVEDMSRSNIILWVKKSLEEGKLIKVVDDQWRTPTLAEDLAMGVYLIAKKKEKGIFNVSGKDFLSPYQMALATADFFELDKSLIQRVDSTTFSQPAKRPPKTGFIIEKARKILGYQPHSFQEGLELLQKQMKELKSITQ